MLEFLRPAEPRLTWTRLAEKTILRRPQGFQRFVELNGYRSLILIASQDGALIRIMSSSEPKGRFSKFKSDSTAPVELMRLWWLAGKPVARRIEHAFAVHFGQSKRQDGWFEVSIAQAARLVEQTARDLGTWAIDEGSMIARMDHKARLETKVPTHAPSPLRGLRTPEFRYGNPQPVAA